MTVILNNLLWSVAEDSARREAYRRFRPNESRQLIRERRTASAARRPEASAPFSDGCSRWSPHA